ncbi:hypothetical protein METEAL_27670 [Mesoterricola silvestris]|uniref:RHS repeat-associated core domain-containing protein n=2 Tax=Mesoterricola silvestris TaxID=2927979 RepID=A0AA48H884_9BACT|nr:hypothetical protein METEAL_27670 [Mesoterricola silvestris]
MFQTSFAEQKLDRSRTPVTLQGPVQVEIPTGAIDLSIPLGPGIGARGATFRPTLSMRMSPQARVLQQAIQNLRTPKQQEWVYWDCRLASPQVPDVEFQYSVAQTEYGTATLSPGVFNLVIEDGLGVESSYEVMGHGGASVLGAVPPRFAGGDVPGLLATFGLESFSLGEVKALTAQYDLSRISSTDDLVLGLSSGQDPQLHYQANPLHDLYSEICHVPRFVVVVRSDVAFLFEFLHPMYEHVPSDWVPKPDNVPLRGATYRLVRIMNRFKEYIRITYESENLASRYFAAEWVTQTDQAPLSGPMVALEMKSSQAPIPIPGTPGLQTSQLSGATELEVNYLNMGTTAAPHISLCVSSLDGGTVPQPAIMPPNFKGMDCHTWNQPISQLQPLTVTQDVPSPAQSLTFHYGHAPGVSWPLANEVIPTVLTAIDHPGGGTSLFWAPHTFRLNYNPWAYNGLTAGQATFRRVPAFAWGVVGSSVQDSATMQTRATEYVRTLPQMNWATDIPADYTSSVEERWVSTDFNVVVAHPDGTLTKHVFASPATTGGGACGPAGLQDLAFIKHLELKTIESAPGTPDRITLNDHLSLLRAGNLSGELGNLTVPVATRTRSWDGETGIQTQTKKWYNSATLGWDRSTTQVGITASPEGIELADSGKLDDLAPPFYSKSSTSTLESLTSAWLLGRVVESSTTINDPWGYNPGRTMPWQSPAETRTLNPTNNRLEGSTKGPLKTSFEFSTGDSPNPFRVQVSSTSTAIAGTAGASYGYDGFGYLASITQATGVGPDLSVTQTNDLFGRATSQGDPNGLMTTITWDGAGRMEEIKPPGEIPSRYEIHPDNLGISIKRGSDMETQLRFNAFGEMVLERRKALDPMGTEIWSYRIHGRDSLGHPTGDTVWLPGKGAETDWAVPNLVWEVHYPATTYNKCVEWGRAEDGTPACLRYQTLVVPEYTAPAQYKGTSIVVDGRGREILRREPLDPRSPSEPATLITRTTHSGLTQHVTVAEGLPEAQVTELTRDPLGRLAKVTNVKGNWVSEQGLSADLVSSYWYDVHGKLSKVLQTDVARGLSQIRTWTTNDFGWLLQLVQPESGETDFSEFNVLGLPGIADYAGLKVETTYDLTGRPLTVGSGGATLQSFTYDTAPQGKGKIARGTDGAITCAYAYNSDNGRLETLDTTAMGETFRQNYQYDSLGQRKSATVGRVQGGTDLVDSHTVDWLFDPARGIPNTVRYDGQYVANASHQDVSWQMAGLSWATSAASFYTYGIGQSRLTGILHRFKDGLGAPQSVVWDFRYDGAGRLIGDGEDAFTYDALNRLRTASIKLPEAPGSMVQAFDYDGFGNLISSTSTNAPAWVKMGFTFSPYSDALKSSNHMPATTASGGSTGAHYNAQGHLDQVNAGLGGRGLALVYDPLGRVTRMDRGDGVTEAYQYTHGGLRTVIQEWQGTVLQRVRLNLYNDQRQMVSQWVME